MNQIILKRTACFSLILGALIGIFSLIPPFIGYGAFALAFLASIIIILFMKKDEKHIAYLTNEQSAVLGGLIGFCSSVGFFISFCPLVCVIKLMLKNFYAYMIPEVLSEALWLFVIIVLMVSLVCALTNSASAMGINWLIQHFEKKPENYDARLDIKIED